MDYLRGSTHPATLLRKCPECNFILKNQFRLSSAETRPHWDLFCHNLTCSLFGEVQICYTFEHNTINTITDSDLRVDTKPDTSIESD